MKTVEELNALKEEVEALNKKLAELNEEELSQVSGGSISPRMEEPIGHNPDCKPKYACRICGTPETFFGEDLQAAMIHAETKHGTFNAISIIRH